MAPVLNVKTHGCQINTVRVADCQSQCALYGEKFTKQNTVLKKTEEVL